MDRATKEAEITSLSDSFTKAQIALCADYRGLTVLQFTNLRRELRKAGATGKVVRNTLARRSVSKAHGNGDTGEVDKFLKTLDGPSFVVFSFKDPVAPTKVLAKFAKDHEKFGIKGAWLDGQFVDQAGVNSLSTMPGREETYAMLLSLLSAPATRLARLIKEPGAQLVRVIEARRKSLEG